MNGDKSKEYGLERMKRGIKEKKRKLEINYKSQRAAGRKRRGGEKEGLRCWLMTWLKMSCNMRHFPCGSLELVPELRDLQSSHITCSAAGGQIHINIRLSSKLVSKSELAALMCMNESLCVFETVCSIPGRGEW